MQVQILRDRSVDDLEEPQELLVAMPAVLLGDHRAALDVEGGEQAGGAVADVVMAHPGRRGREHRQDRGRAVEGLDVAFLVDGQDQGVLRRGQVETDDVTDLVHKQRIGGQLPGLHRMGFQPERPPDPRHRGLVQPGLGGHRSGRPVTVAVRRFLFQGLGDQCLDLLVADHPRPARARLVREALQSLGDEPSPPLGHHLPAHPQPFSDLAVRPTVGRRQDDP